METHKGASIMVDFGTMRVQRVISATSSPKSMVRLSSGLPPNDFGRIHSRLPQSLILVAHPPGRLQR